MSTNLFSQFRRLLPQSPLLVGEVLVSTGGTTVVEFPGGAQVSVRGEATVGEYVFVRNGAVESVAPAFTPATIEI